jgi:hypothetical protein
MADELMIELNKYFERQVNIKRRVNGNQQQIESLISEECMELARYLRNDISQWIPRLMFHRCLAVWLESESLLVLADRRPLGSVKHR